ncbi:MAG: hypothetical protein ACLQU2_32880 [Candidatus Binataceae bacterium]
MRQKLERGVHPGKRALARTRATAAALATIVALAIPALLSLFSEPVALAQEAEPSTVSGASQGSSLGIISPSDGSAVQGAPVELRVAINDVSAMGIRALLNGRDISAIFAQPIKGIRRAQVFMRDFRLGANELEVTDGTSTTRVKFTFMGARLGDGQSQPLYVPIRTRVPGPNGPSSIQVGSNNYSAENPNAWE